MLLSYVFLNIENRAKNEKFESLNFSIEDRVLEHMKDLEAKREQSYARVVEGKHADRERTLSRQISRSNDDRRKPEEISLREITFFSGNPAVEVET